MDKKKEDKQDDFDPDVCLSYIDDKLQSLLGHFQKDFEGHVRKENLAAKYGGYGTFLPVHELSPTDLSPERTPPNVHILEMMTSFPIPGEVSLSPLSDSLLCLAEKPACMEPKPTENPTSYPVRGECLQSQHSDSLVRSRENSANGNCELLATGDAREVEKVCGVREATLNNTRRWMKNGRIKRHASYYTKFQESKSAKDNLADKVCKDRKIAVPDDAKSDRTKDGIRISDRDRDSFVHQSCTKDHFDECLESREKVSRKGLDQEQGGTVESPRKEQRPSGGYKKASHVTTPKSSEKGHVSDVAPPEKIIEESWVCCDKCKKWRLLPYGTNADHLENDVWHCSMLDWLPGMNHCEFSEDETTKALHRLYEISPFDQSVSANPTEGKKKERDFDDAKQFKTKYKRLRKAHQDDSRVTKKIESESMNEANGDARKLSSGLSSNIPIEKNEQKQQTSASSDGGKTYQKVTLSGLEMKPRVEVKISFKGSTDRGNSGKARPSNVRSFQESNERANSSGAERKLGYDSSKDFPIQKRGQRRRVRSFSSDSDEESVSALVEKPKDHLNVSLNGRDMGREKPNTVKVAAENVEKESSPSNVQDFECNIKWPKESGASSFQNSECNIKRLTNESAEIAVKKNSCPSSIQKSECNNKNLETGHVTGNPASQKDDKACPKNDPEYVHKNWVPAPVTEQRDVGRPNKVMFAFKKRKVETRPGNVLTDQLNNEETSKSLEKGGGTGKPECGLNNDFPIENPGRRHRARSSSTYPKSDQLNIAALMRMGTNNMRMDTHKIKAHQRSVHGSRERITETYLRNVHSLQDNNGHSKEKKARVPKSDCEDDCENGNAVSTPITEINNETGPNILHDETKAPQQQGKPYKQSENIASIRSTADELIREGEDLMEKADRLKKFVSELEGTGISFQAALKYLRGAFILETVSDDLSENGYATHSVLTYRKAAQHFKSVAQAYESCNEMAAASLAFKCLEVSYMRIVYSRNFCLYEDLHELRKDLPDTSHGATPSSSESEVDNFNQGPLTGTFPGNGDDSRIGEEYTIAAKNVPKFHSMLKHAEVVNYAMEALTKCQQAFAAATRQSQVEFKHAAGIPMVEDVVTSSFHDIVGLIRLVQLALDEITE